MPLPHLSGSSSSASGPTRLGPYQLLRELGRGSNGVVYLARREGSDEACALKAYLPAAGDREGIARFDLEVAVARGLSHPGIVRAFESGHEGAIKWLAMDYVAGETLQDRLARGPLTAGDVRRLGVEVAEALDYAHGRGVIHRDLKPANILLSSRDGRARLTDFGLAREAHSSLTQSGDLLGTPYYMAPEQYRSAKTVDPRADVYALGAILYECLAGARPFEAATIPEVAQLKERGDVVPLERVAPATPLDLIEVVRCAMQRDPADRYPSARDLALALAGSEPLPGDAARGPSHDRLVKLLIAAVAALAVCVVSLAVWRGRVLQRRADDRQRLVFAREALEAGNAQEALQTLKGVRLQPRDELAPERDRLLAQANLLEGVSEAERRLELGEPEPARELLSRGLPEESGARLRAALTAFEVRQLDPERATASQVLASSRQVLELEDAPGARSALARCALAVARRQSKELARFEEPLDLLDAAERLSDDPDLTVEIGLERASYMFRRGRFERASELAGELTRHPGRLGLQARYVAAFGQLWQDRNEIGLGGLRDIWRDDPDGVVGLNAGAVFHSYTGRNDIGEQMALRSLDLDPSYVDAWISLTFCRNDLSLQTGDRSKLPQALESAAEALRLQPDHPRAYLAQAYASGNIGQDRLRRESYDRLIELTEPRPFARALRHRAQIRLGDRDLRGAKEDLGRAIERNARDVEALIWRGIVSWAGGDERAASVEWIQAYERCGELAIRQGLGRVPENLRQEIVRVLTEHLEQQRRR